MVLQIEVFCAVTVQLQPDSIWQTGGMPPPFTQPSPLFALPSSQTSPCAEKAKPSPQSGPHDEGALPRGFTQRQ
ncbi:MAG: hypothetical protein Q8O67_29775 [Deltaproteobacteria bacterium]|nr:hypothetical protein [Deltaproteobacteria bacterium]